MNNIWILSGIVPVFGIERLIITAAIKQPWGAYIHRLPILHPNGISLPHPYGPVSIWLASQPMASRHPLVGFG